MHNMSDELATLDSNSMRLRLQDLKKKKTAAVLASGFFLQC